MRIYSSLLFFTTCTTLTMNTLNSQASELYYEDCKESRCIKSYISQKSKIGDNIYAVSTMSLNYKSRGSNTADEDNKSAKIYCDKVNASVVWGGGKAQKIDKSVFAKPSNPKKGKPTQADATKKYDETTSLWKAICPIK